jgi:hypothetical protein
MLLLLIQGPSHPSVKIIVASSHHQHEQQKRIIATSSHHQNTSTPLPNIFTALKPSSGQIQCDAVVLGSPLIQITNWL